MARETWAATYAGIIPENAQKEFVERVYSDEVLAWRAGRGTFLVADSDGSIAGFADFNRPFDDDRIVSLAAIYVSPNEQRRGFGGMLLEEGIRREEGVKEIVVRFVSENIAARNFYERHDFERVGESDEDFLGHPSRMVEMKLPRRM